MDILLIIPGIYLIIVVASHIVAYVYWSKNDKKGSTLADLYQYASNNLNFPLPMVWIPGINCIIVILVLFIAITNPVRKIINYIGNFKIK